MGIGKSCVIFSNIDAERYSEKEKALAIYDVLSMATHNSIPKDSILKVTRYLFDKLYEVDETKGGNQ